jgi:hypothetical protein
MVALGDELTVAGWRVRLRYIALGDERADISAAYIAQAAGGRANRRLGRAGLPNLLSKPVVADDRGTTLTLDFRGGGSDDRWEGRLTADQPLATETTWIELFDRRIELADAPVEEPWRSLPGGRVTIGATTTSGTGTALTTTTTRSRPARSRSLRRSIPAPSAWTCCPPV